MTRPTDWCYPSGVVAVLETSLFGSGTLGELAGSAPSPDEIFSRVRRSRVYGAVEASEADDAMRAAASLESAVVGFARSLAAQCPDERVADVFLVEYDLRDLSNYLKWKYCGAERRPVELSTLPEERTDQFIVEQPRLARLAEATAEVAEAAEGQMPSYIIDLMIDGAFIGMLPELTEPLSSEIVDEWAAERRRTAAVEAVVRAKMAGVSSSDIHHYVLARLPSESAMATLADAAPDNLSKALADAVSPEIAEGFTLAAGPSGLLDLTAQFDAALERILEPARYVASGPERVFSFLWHLFRENRNLRALLGGSAGGIEPEVVARSMRGVNV